MQHKNKQAKFVISEKKDTQQLRAIKNPNSLIVSSQTISSCVEDGCFYFEDTGRKCEGDANLFLYVKSFKWRLLSLS